MKRILTFIFTACAVIACSHEDSAMRNFLQNDAISRHQGITSYKLVQYFYTDTFTVADRVKELSGFEKLYSEANIESIKTERDNNFSSVYGRDKNYEYDIMHGRLKDLSEWTTDLRVTTEKADSILALGNKADKSDFDFIYVYWWYMTRHAQFYGTMSNQDRDDMLELIRNNKSDIIEYRDLKLERDQNRPLRITITHLFTAKNPFGEKGNYSDEIIVTPEQMPQ